jgi:hypothetical protein
MAKTERIALTPIDPPPVLAWYEEEDGHNFDVVP